MVELVFKEHYKKALTKAMKKYNRIKAKDLFIFYIKAQFKYIKMNIKLLFKRIDMLDMTIFQMEKVKHFNTKKNDSVLKIINTCHRLKENETNKLH